MKAFVALSLPLSLLATVSMLAQAPGSPFDRWDKNKDGKVSREEFPEQIRKNFERVDGDGDGFVSREEDAAFRRNRPPGAPGTGPKGRAFPMEGIKKIGDIDYAGTGNPRQTLDLYLPENREGNEPLPIVVFIHGGGWQNGDKGGGGARVAPFVSTGKYAGASIGYRLSGEARWPAQIHDCKAAIRWIKANAAEHGLDPGRVAVWGSSAGGHLVAMLGVSHGVADLEGTIGKHTDESAQVKCVVDFFGPAEMLTMGGRHNDANSPEAKLLGGAVGEIPDIARNASPVEHVTADDAPFLIVHGDEDGTVPFAQSAALEKELEAAGVPAILVTVAGGGHGQGFGAEVNEIVTGYLGKQLLGESHEISDRTVPAAR